MLIIVATGLSTALCLAYMVRALIRNPANPGLRAACAGMFAMLASLGLGLVTGGAEARHPIAVADWRTSVVQHLITMSCLYFWMVFFAYSVHPRPEAAALARRHGVVLLAAATIAVTFAALADPEDYSAAFFARYRAAPVAAWYLATYAGYVLAMVTAVMVLSWRWSRLASDRWIRRGMAVGAAGCAVGVAYCAVKIAYILMERTGVNPPTHEMAVTGPLILVAVPLTVGGLTVPGWGPRITALVHWLSRYRAHRQLHPLWSALVERFPHISMDLGRAGLANLDLQLHLRVVQIWDARRALAGYCDPAAHERGRLDGVQKGLTGDALSAYAEAAMLADALWRYTDNDRVEANEPLPAVVDAPDLAGNVAWLRRVSRFLPSFERAEPRRS